MLNNFPLTECSYPSMYKQIRSFILVVLTVYILVYLYLFICYTSTSFSVRQYLQQSLWTSPIFIKTDISLHINMTKVSMVKNVGSITLFHFPYNMYVCTTYKGLAPAE